MCVPTEANAALNSVSDKSENIRHCSAWGFTASKPSDLVFGKSTSCFFPPVIQSQQDSLGVPSEEQCSQFSSLSSSQLLRRDLGSGDGISKSFVSTHLCYETLNLILSFLDPIEVSVQIKALSRDFCFFVEHLWIPTSLRITPQWVERFVAACTARRMAPNLLQEQPQPEAGPPFLVTAHGDVLLPTTGLNGGITDAHAIFMSCCDAIVVPICRRPSQAPKAVDIENQSPSAFQAAVDRSALSLLRALAQDTFLFLSLTENPEWVPPWYRRCQNRLEKFTYIQNVSAPQTLQRQFDNDSPNAEYESSCDVTPRQPGAQHGIPDHCRASPSTSQRRFHTPVASPTCSSSSAVVSADVVSADVLSADVASAECASVPRDSFSQIDSLSLLDVLLLFLASSRTIKIFVLETTAHFSSFLQGPAIPRCPVSLSRRECSDSLPSSCLINPLPSNDFQNKIRLRRESASSEFPDIIADATTEVTCSHREIHWECWELLLQRVLPPVPMSDAAAFEFHQLTYLNLSGSYLPASLAILASISNLRFPQLRRLCIKGALVVGRPGLEALELAKLHPSPVPSNLVRLFSWWTRDLVACLLFAANPFRGLSCPSSVNSSVSGRTLYWARALLNLFACHRFPRLETLELRIGCGPLERRVWWCLLLTELFLSDTLRFLELDCTIESLTCFLPEPVGSEISDFRISLLSATCISQKPSVSPSTPREFGRGHRILTPGRATLLSTYATPRSIPSPAPSSARHRRQHSVEMAARRQSLAATLFSDPRRFPALEVIRVTSAYTLTDIIRLEDFIASQLPNRHVLVQVRRLHLFVEAQNFADQCDAYCHWNDRRQGHGISLFTPGDDPALTLDFSSAFPAAARRRRIRRLPTPSAQAPSRNHTIPGIRKLVISRFNPLCHSHYTTLAAIRFPYSLSRRSTTSLVMVSVRLGLPENLIYYTNKNASPSWEAPGCLKRARDSLWAALNTHPDISQTREIQVLPSPFWLRGI